MSQTKTEVYLLGPAAVSVGGNDIGYVEDIALELEFTDVVATVAKYGDTPLKAWHLATKARLKFPMHQINYARYAEAIQGSSNINDGSDYALGIGSSAGLALTGVEIIVTPEQSATLGDIGLLKMWSCVPRDSRALNWGKEHQMLEVTWEALVQESKPEGEKLGRFGNATVSADTTPPTVTTATPLDDATGVVVSISPTLLWSESMDAATITSDNIFLIAGVDSSGPQVPIAATVTHNADTDTTTINPTSDLSTATLYELIITTAVKDASGNAFAGEKYSFTTA